MSILKNFRNPWEDDNWVLQTDVLDTSVLDTDVIKKKPNGDYFPPSTLSGANSKSTKRLLKEIQDTFKGTEAEKLVKSWYIENDGITLESDPLFYYKIRTIKDFDTRTLLKAYFNVMTNRVHIIEMITREEYLSKYGKEQLQLTNYKKETFEYKTGKSVDEEDGGGKSVIANWDEDKSHLWKNAQEGSYCVIIMNSTAKVEQYSDGILKPSLKGEILAHELLGHGVGRYYETYQSDGRDEAIQMGNLYLRIKKQSYYRTDHGTDHSQNFNPNGYPIFYRLP
jgi:hypothetical protein